MKIKIRVQVDTGFIIFNFKFKSNKRSKKVPNSNSRPLQPTRVWREESASFIVSITNQILKVIKKDERVYV